MLVVLAHVNIYTRAGVETWWPGGFYGVPLLSLAVPSFFAIAGYAVDKGTSAGGGSGSGALSRLARLVVPFLVWNFITLLVMNGGIDLNRTTVSYLLTGTWHLYFIFALLQLLLIYMVLFRKIDSVAPRTLLIASVALSCIAYGVAEWVVYTKGINGGASDPDLRKLFPFWTGFFGLGIWYRRRSPSLNRRSAAILIVLLAAAYFTYIADLKIEDSIFSTTPLKQLLLGGFAFQTLGAFAMLALFENLARTTIGMSTTHGLAKLGRDTYGIYLVHISVMIAVYQFLLSRGYATTRAFEVPLLTALIFLLSWLTVGAIRRVRVPALQFVLIGEKVKQKASAPELVSLNY